ncbi:MAG: lytic transglycosylase domain-containing protein [Xanthomonadales bacterium]|nr:lytic transglycosylase domain-containing protein [Xanthomonadales bacterium]
MTEAQAHRRHRASRPAAWLLALGALASADAGATTVEIPVPLDYGIVKHALEEQVFNGPDGTATVFSDATGCNHLILANPEVSGSTDRVRLQTVMRARAGTPIGSSCRFARDWSGIIEVLQRADVDPDGSSVRFHVTDSRLLSTGDGNNVLPPFVHDWILDYLHPRLDTVHVDLSPVRDGIQEVLDSLSVSPPGADEAAAPLVFPPIRLAAVQPDEDRFRVTLAFEADDPPPSREPSLQASLSEAELAEWDTAWQAWDGFATWLIKTLTVTAASGAGPALTAALAETLLKARYDLRDALARDERERDPVRELFLKTWTRLAPVVRDLQAGLPGSQALPFATFLSAGDALTAMDRLAPHIGFRLDQDSLRQMARVLVPGVTDYHLRYNTALDPELRELFGFDPDFEAGTVGPSATFAWLSWLVPDAHAALLDPQLVQRLNSWAPRRRDVDDYLETMELLLRAIATAERDRGKVPDEHLDQYDTLLRATAWQESCWRQYVEGEEGLETIRSSAGSVGLMQVNMHVWRGIYDIDQLLGDVGYNARAGNEILVHYLVDYAIRKGEDQAEGGPDNLARATYAIYNGGPRHLKRYRNPDTSASLKKIDRAFWIKYQAIQSEGPSAVKRCLAG